MNFKKRLVDAALRPFINYYYILESEEMLYDSYPLGTFDLVFGHFRGSEYRGKQLVKTTEATSTLFFAQQEQPFTLFFAPNTKIFVASFKPEGFYKILQFPLGEMSNAVWDLSDHLPKTFQYFNEALIASKTDDQLFQKMDQFFIQQFYKANAVLSPFDRLLDYIRQQKGDLSIDEMAYTLNVSRRTLNRLFAKHLGITAKSYTSILRFQQAILNYYHKPHLGWSGILYNSSYYDQNHFIKDFKRYTGKTPTLFLDTNRSVSDFFLKD